MTITGELVLMAQIQETLQTCQIIKTKQNGNLRTIYYLYLYHIRSNKTVNYSRVKP